MFFSKQSMTREERKMYYAKDSCDQSGEISGKSRGTKGTNLTKSRAGYETDTQTDKEPCLL